MNLAFVEHDCETRIYRWILRKEQEDIYIYIWEDEYGIEDWFMADFLSENFTSKYEEIPNVTKNLIFSLKGKMKDFAATVIKTIDQLKLRATELDKAEEWGYKFSEVEYQKLKEIL